MQDYIPASVSYGICYNGELIALMSFDKTGLDNKSSWELLYYCNKQGIDVTKGASNLFNKFIKEYNPSAIIGHADRMWGICKLYKNLGFDFSHSTDPEPYYTNNYIIFEKQIIGKDRIWDCGQNVWIWSKQT